MRKIALAFFLMLIFLVSGCSGKKDVKKSLEEIRTGTEGISVSFLPNNPPAAIHAGSTDPLFDVVLELRNRGAYPQPDERREQQQVKVYISGYDGNIISLTPKQEDIRRLANSLEGKSTVNVVGGTDLVTFNGKVTVEKLNVEKYEPILLATICYQYHTIAGPSVCIDPDPYSTLTQKKVCEVADISLSSQGAPIAVTAIEEEAFQEKTQFKISIKNVGNGDVITKEAIANKCDPLAPNAANKIGRDDIDRVFLDEVNVGGTQLECSPFAKDPVRASQGVIRLINGEGYVICELRKDYEAYRISKTSFTTPINVKLSYGYRTTAQRSLQIKKEASGFSAGTAAP